MTDRVRFSVAIKFFTVSNIALKAHCSGNEFMLVWFLVTLFAELACAALFLFQIISSV